MITYEEYSNYLRQRSRLGFLYRRYILYPRLIKYVKGDALDLGCGIGDFVSYYKNTIGVDINPENIKICKQRGLNVRVMMPDELPFDNKVFDTIIMDNVLEHIATPEKIIQEVKRVIRRGGHFIVGVPGERGYASDPDHKVFYDEDALAALLINNGFKVLKIIRMPLPVASLSKYLKIYCIYGICQALPE